MLQLVVFKCGNLSAGECEEPDIRTQHDDEDHHGVSPLVSTVLSQSDDNNNETAEDSQCLPEMHTNSIELEKDRSTVEAVAILASTSLPAASDQFNPPSRKEDGKIIFSEETHNMDDFPVSKNISETATNDVSIEYVPKSSNDENIGVAFGDPQPLPVLGSNLVERVEEDLASLNVQAAPGKGTDEIIEFSEHLQGATNSISETTNDTENEYGKALVDENKNHRTSTGVLDTTANVAVPAFNQEISNQSHKNERLEAQESTVPLEKDLDTKVVSTSIRMLDGSNPNYMKEKVEVGLGSGLREADNQSVRETDNLAMTQTEDLKNNVDSEECFVSTSRDSAANAEKAVDKLEDTSEDTLKEESENNLAPKPQPYDSLTSNCILEPDVALSSPVPLSGSQSAGNEHRETKESDGKISCVTCSEDAAPGVSETPSHSLSDLSSNDAQMTGGPGFNSDIPETTLLSVPLPLAFKSESAGDGKEHEEMVQPIEHATPLLPLSNSSDGDVNIMSDLPEDKSCAEAEVTDKRENEEVSISATGVSGPIQESCEFGGGEDAISDVVNDRIGNESTELHSDAPILTTEVSHSAEDAVASDIIMSGRCQDQSSEGKPAIESGSDKHTIVDDLQVEEKDLDPKSGSTEETPSLPEES